MAQLKLLLGGKQPACFARYVANDENQACSGRSIFFSAEADDEQKLNGKPLQATGHNITVREEPNVEMSGLLEYSDALDANGKPTQAQADVTLSFPHHAFEQLLAANLDNTKLYLHINTDTVNYEVVKDFGGGNAIIQTARISFLKKETPAQEPVNSKILNILYGMLVALVIIIIILSSH